MSIPLKAELETWAAALKAYDEQDFVKALDLFSLIADSSKILTNMGLIYATIGEHETAVEHFVAAINLDSYLAIAHFQCGVSNFLLERYELALLNFEDAYLYLRGNETINYEQIGLKFKLFSAEILFNKGLTQLNLGYTDQGMADMQEASRQEVTDEHRVIDDAIRDRGEGYTVFSIPVGVLYRPSENKLKNSKSKDYLGKAKLVAASDSDDAFTEFTGVKKLQQASGENHGNKDDENTSNVELSVRSTTVPVLRTEPVGERALERSKTTPQPRVVARPDVATILASRRTKSESNPANVPPLPLASGSNLSRNNTTLLARSAATSAPAEVVPLPLRVKTSQGTTSIGTGGTRASEGLEAATGEASTALRSRPSLRRLREAPQVVQQSATERQSPSLLPGQYANKTEGVTSTVLPAGPPKGGGHLTQFYDAYIDVYADKSVLNSAISRSPTSRTQSIASSSSSQRPSLASAPISVRTSSSTSTSANIRVKLHYQGDVRGMMLSPTTSFNDFVKRVTTKFGTSLRGLGMKFVDEEGTMISLRDEGDFELAIETNGRSLEVWCVDT